MLKFAITALLFIFCNQLSAGNLSPYKGEKCVELTNLTPEHQQLWLDCCGAHDLSYWHGGSYKEQLTADRTLKQCVAVVGDTSIIVSMLKKVKVGGSPYLPTEYRWGYGWSNFRGFDDLTEAELKEIQALKSKQ